MITMDAGKLINGEPGAEGLQKVLRLHDEKAEGLCKLRSVLNMEHSITGRTRLRGLPNNKLAHDLPGYIVTMAAGYLVGEPVTYTASEEGKAAFAPILEALKAAVSDNVDAELAVDASAYGKGIEVYYADGQSRPRIAQVDPISSFVVYDDTVECRPLFGVTAVDVPEMEKQSAKQRVTVYTEREVIAYERRSRGGELCEKAREFHYFGGVPLVEYWNNKGEKGDFERVLGLIDAYDALQSDRVNDKQQFTDAILALYGIGSLGAEDTEEYGSRFSEEEESFEERSAVRKEKISPSQRLRQTKTLFMPGEGAKAEWLAKPMAEADAEILRKSLKTDIHKLSMVPDLTDDNFAGNVSGVAMRFKLLGLEQLTKIKERWFREGLRSRLRLFAAFLSMRGGAAVDVDTVQISFKRSLPVNEIEVAQMVQAYDGIVPRELLLSQVPFVEDTGEALKLAEKERQADMKWQESLAVVLGRKDEAGGETVAPVP